MKRFSQLTQTATETDLVAGNFLAIDVPGVGGATKKLPGEIFKGIGQIKKNIIDYLPNQVSVVSSTDLQSIENSNVLAGFKELKVKTTAASYCGVEVYIRNFVVGKSFMCGVSRDVGNDNVFRVRFYDSADSVISSHNNVDGKAARYTIPSGTAYINITLMACWGTPLGANTEVTFSDFLAEYEIEKKVIDFMAEFKSEISTSHATISTQGLNNTKVYNNVLTAEKIELTCDGTSYCGAEFFVYDVPKQRNFVCNYTATGGNSTTRVRILAYDKDDQQVGVGYTNLFTIPASTSYLKITIMACWGTALANGTKVTFSNIEMYYTFSNVANDLVVGDGTFKYYGVSRPIFKQAEVLGCTKSNVLNKTKVTGDPSNWVGAQSMAIYGGYVFSFSDGTACTVIDLTDNSVVAVITMPVTSHYAGASFTDTFVDAADDFPLIAMELGTADGEVGFFRIQNSGGTWSATLYKKVSIDDSSYKTHGGVASYDIVSKCLYVQAFTKGGWNVQTDNPVKFFRTPEIDLSTQTTQAIDEVEVIGYLPFYVIQDAKVVGDLWILASQALGAGSWWKAKFPNAYSNIIIILDKSDLSIRNVFYTRTQEPEGIDVVDNKIYLSSRNTSAAENAECFWLDTFEV